MSPSHPGVTPAAEGELSPYRRRTATVLATAENAALQAIWAVSANGFARSRGGCLRTHNPLVAGSSPARPTEQAGPTSKSPRQTKIGACPAVHHVCRYGRIGHRLIVLRHVMRHRGFCRPVVDNARHDAIAGARPWRVRFHARRFCGCRRSVSRRRGFRLALGSRRCCHDFANSA